MTTQERDDLIARGVSTADIAAFDRITSATSRANRDPLPGPLKKAFAGDPVTCFGLTFRPPQLGDVILLERMGSPMHQLMSGQNSGEPKFNMNQVFDLVYLWTHEYGACVVALRSGIDEWRAMVDEFVIALQLPIGALDKLGEAIRANLDHAFATSTAWRADKDGEQVFTMPPAAPTTAQAGGLPS
jgi:hypothetical protein